MAHTQEQGTGESNPPWYRCPERATHSEAVTLRNDERSFVLYVCEEHWSGRVSEEKQPEDVVQPDDLVDAAREFVAAFPGNKVAQLGNGNARKAHQRFAAILDAAEL